MQTVLPTAFLASLEGLRGYDPASFKGVHETGVQVTSIRVNPRKISRNPWALSGVDSESRVPWSGMGYYLDERPSFTFDPLLHAGAYYVQEASSMFLEQALRQTTDLARPLRVLDLCAAPGGKSTLVQSILSADSLLVSNEVIRTRVNILQENMVKWGGANVVVTSNDPRDFQRMENYFDVIVVDAPCSGSGLFRREPGAIAEWSPENVQLCRHRQQRILADCWPALRQDGVLIYSTCSYSREEDEDVLDWIMENLSASSLRLELDASWNIVETTGEKGGYGYRFYPDRLKGEGLFLACVRKRDGGAFAGSRNRKQGQERLSKAETGPVLSWIDEKTPLSLFRHENKVNALPESLAESLPYLQSCCYIRQAGVVLGQLTPKGLIPEHNLAVSVIVNGGLPSLDLSKEAALQYLRKEDISKEDMGLEQTGAGGNAGKGGWFLVRYQGLNLGWVKVLSNRVNNYYPKEWRILRR